MTRVTSFKEHAFFRKCEKLDLKCSKNACYKTQDQEYIICKQIENTKKSEKMKTVITLKVIYNLYTFIK